MTLSVTSVAVYVLVLISIVLGAGTRSAQPGSAMLLGGFSALDECIRKSGISSDAVGRIKAVFGGVPKITQTPSAKERDLMKSRAKEAVKGSPDEYKIDSFEKCMLDKFPPANTNIKPEKLRGS